MRFTPVRPKGIGLAGFIAKDATMRNRRRGKPGLLLTVIAIAILSLFGFKCSLSKKVKQEETKIHVTAFVSEWCGPCNRAKTILIAMRSVRVQVEFIDIDEQPELAKQNKITSVPTFFVTVNNKITRTQSVSVVVSIIMGNIK